MGGPRLHFCHPHRRGRAGAPPLLAILQLVLQATARDVRWQQEAPLPDGGDDMEAGAAA